MKEDRAENPEELHSPIKPVKQVVVTFSPGGPWWPSFPG